MTKIIFLNQAKSPHRKQLKFISSSLLASLALSSILATSYQAVSAAATDTQEKTILVKNTEGQKTAAQTNLVGPQDLSQGTDGTSTWTFENGTLTISGGHLSSTPVKNWGLTGIEQIVFAGPVTLAANSAHKFDDLSSLKGFTGLELVDTSNVTSMTSLFSNDTALSALDLSSWNTSNVDDFQWTFSNTPSLTNLNISGWQTGSARSMTAMFYGCYAQAIDVSSFNTSNVTSMAYMFANTVNLTSLDLSSFNTDNTLYLFNMFALAPQVTSKLSALDISNFNTNAAKNLMFGMLANVGSNPNGFALTLGSKNALDQNAFIDPDSNVPLNMIHIYPVNTNAGGTLDQPHDDEIQLQDLQNLYSNADAASRPNETYVTWKSRGGSSQPEQPAEPEGTEEPTNPQQPENTEEPTKQPETPSETQTPAQPGNSVSGSSTPATSDSTLLAESGLPILTEKILHHNAYVYNQNGQRANNLIIKVGSIVETYGTTTINGRKFYNLGQNLYTAAGNIDEQTRTLKKRAYVYDQHGESSGRLLTAGQTVTTHGDPVKIKGKEYYLIGENQLVKKVNFANTLPTASRQKEVTGLINNGKLQHSAYIYDQNGQRTNKIILNLGSRIYAAVSETINGRRFYEFANGKRIAAGNIDGNIRKLTQNAYIYDQHAHRVGKKKLAGKAKIRTYGNPVKIKGKAYYIIGDKRYIKRTNFK